MKSNLASQEFVHSSLSYYQLNDDELMLLASQNDKEAFLILFKRYSDLVYRLAAGYFSKGMEINDVVQDVFCMLWAVRNRYKFNGKFRNYVITMTLNRCHFVARTEKNRKKKLEDYTNYLATIPEGRSSPDEELEDSQSESLVREKLQHLPERVRQVLVLRFLKGMTHQQISEVLNSPPGTVRSDVSRGVKSLHRLVKKNLP
jgi:RNA polymerase sigma-70 factor (ECF subfamily)